MFIEKSQEDEIMEQHFVEVETVQKECCCSGRTTIHRSASGNTTNHRGAGDGESTTKGDGNGEA